MDTFEVECMTDDEMIDHTVIDADSKRDAASQHLENTEESHENLRLRVYPTGEPKSATIYDASEF